MPGKNGPNTCQGAMHGTGRYDCSCPVLTNGGVQCRTRPEMRPCGTPSCVRWECAATNVTTNNGSDASSVPVGQSREEEPTYNLTGLTRTNLRTLEHALRARERDAKVGDDYAELRKLRDMVCDLL